ncbi:uncharacterized protein LOC112089280 [Eutrema salsugineum]|nr:uncharacterized protein LOC112089280 [Eutrema salsugineum]
MSAAMDKALMAMSLEEVEEPFDMPDLPEYCSSGENGLSLVGRLLNPDCQKMANLILDMPRKWQKYDKVTGVALTKEKFQFFFKEEHDLIEILEKGVHTYNDWALAMERWVAKPPEDYLQFIPLWVQIRHIPMNHRTVRAITALGEFVGRVVEVVFDPAKAQSQDFV